MSDNMSIDKKDPSKENSEDESPVSTPENEAGPSIPSENQPAKRKGGRKPVSSSRLTQSSYCLKPMTTCSLSRPIGLGVEGCCPEVASY